MRFIMSLEAKNKEEALELLADACYCVDNIMTEEEFIDRCTKKLEESD